MSDSYSSVLKASVSELMSKTGFLGEGNTLLVRHLPSQLTDKDKEELFRHFGGIRVKVMGTKGPMKHTAFVSFPDNDTASQAMNRLHQLDILGCRLVVEYAKKSQAKYFSGISDTHSKASSADDKASKRTDKPDDVKTQTFPSDDMVFKKWGIDYPRNPRLYYLYPPPTVSILTNIANALAASPKLYVQVLHLMNKMNLPAPFGAITPTPPIPTHEPTVILEPDNIQTLEMEVSSTEESEIESEGESQKPNTDKPSLKRQIRKKQKISSKRPKIFQDIYIPAPTTAPIMDPSKVFENPQQQQHQVKKIQLNIPEAIVSHDFQKEQETTKPQSDTISKFNKEEDENKEVGFGKIEPVKKVSQVIEMEESDLPYIVDREKFVSKEEMKKCRISKDEMKNFSVFKKYEAGEITKRLYLKNLAKQTSEQDLVNIYGNYIDWDCDTVKMSFDIRLMREGRMKGQAFITFPTEDSAEKALDETNGYVLNNKPMVVQFARSAKAKDTADGKT